MRARSRVASTPAVVGAIVVTAVVGYVAGTVHGSLYLQPKSIMDAFGLAVYAYLAYLLLPIVGAAVVAASGVSWRWPGLTC